MQQNLYVHHIEVTKHAKKCDSTNISDVPIPVFINVTYANVLAFLNIDLSQNQQFMFKRK